MPRPLEVASTDFPRVEADGAAGWFTVMPSNRVARRLRRSYCGLAA